MLTGPDVARDRDVQRNAIHEREDAPTVSSASFMTPESSPVLPRKLIEPVTPVAGPSSLPHNAHRHDPAVPPLAPSPVITTPVSSHSRGITPTSHLSSPFQNRRSATGRRSAKSPSRSPIPPLVANLPMPDVFSVPPPPSSPPPLATPIPQRALGGEIHRIHLQLAADHAERMAETEARRPTYLVREKRPRSEADIPTLDELDAANATLGVTESPVKGRRLQLFQATSEETFEQSLLAGGYPGYGQSPAYKNGEPQTPKSHSSLSHRALHWLQHATPGQPGPSTAPGGAVPEPPPTEVPDWEPSEQEIRKRRRLDAFREEKREPGTKLYPAVVEGRGRLLLNVPPEGTAVPPDAPAKRKVNKRRRRRGGRRGAPAHDSQEDEPVQPNWPDAAFPWCLRVQERTHAETREREVRLKWIERFLERESDSDSGEADDNQELRPPLRSHENDQVAHPHGRGKMVPLRSNPGAMARVPGEENVLVPSDPADARAALLSKRSVRILATRRREQRSSTGAGAGESELEDVECVGCDRGDDGTELVLCDLCNVWYHLACIGIRHVAELGREEDMWYCDRCLEIQPAPPLEPTLVPTDDRLPARRDSLFLQHPNLLLESPAPWDVVERAPPTTPVRGGGRDADGGSMSMTRTWSTRSSRGAPSTPESSAKTVRVYNTTPNPFDTFDPETPFDPTTTPSRGVKFSGGPPPTLGLSTPKGGVGLWAGRGGATPTPVMSKFAGMGAGAGGESAGPRRLNWNDGQHAYGTPVAGPHARSIYSAAYLEDTPITRAPRTTLLSAGGAGRLLESPGFARRPVTPDGQERKRKRDEDGEVPMETEGASSSFRVGVFEGWV
ncbi:hypothetical protein LXA43DRAFT_1121331 [Ganoderma leucocontextum]|nr:hypothetical protein LXA43DRAFT_1121331 [Ganoderma leucocontextum]